MYQNAIFGCYIISKLFYSLHIFPDYFQVSILITYAQNYLIYKYIKISNPSEFGSMLISANALTGVHKAFNKIILNGH